jgi:peptide deformylase
MLNDMDANDGIGIAAPQVGISKTFFLFRRESNNELVVCVNPQIKELSTGFTFSEEGCLSHPGETKVISRYPVIGACWYDEYGTFFMERLEGRDSIVFQHEMDHLKGKTILSE